MKIALCGYSGKTGKEIYQVLKENNFQVIGIDKNTTSLNDVIEKVDLVVDFTVKEVALKHIDLCIKHLKPFIVGTTGFNSNELARIKSLCKQNNIKGVICYNFSRPLNYLLKHFNFFKKYFKSMTYLDIHHISKVDKTSGTTYLFLLANDKIKIKSLKTNKSKIVYMITMENNWDKMTFIYQVNSKKVFAEGLCDYIKYHDEKQIINLID